MAVSERLRRWCAINWTGFAVTRGGFRDSILFGLPVEPWFYDPEVAFDGADPNEPNPTIEEQARSWMGLWVPWLYWLPESVGVQRFADLFPVLRATRGPIEYQPSKWS